MEANLHQILVKIALGSLKKYQVEISKKFVSILQSINHSCFSFPAFEFVLMMFALELKQGGKHSLITFISSNPNRDLNSFFMILLSLPVLEMFSVPSHLLDDWNRISDRYQIFH